MTTKQSNAIIKNPNTKKAVAVLVKFAKKELAYKEAEKQAKEATELIKQSMIDNDVDKITIDVPGFTGYITLAERTTFKADDLSEVDEKFLKPALNNEAVKAQRTLTGELPAGVTEAKSKYITKKFKAV